MANRMILANEISRNNSFPEKFYLDPKTADVKFVFGLGTDKIEHVPAHRIILSMRSPVFDTMFFGSLPEEGDVPIVDASAAAFKEFLQFFYLGKVELSTENIIGVTNLCKMYEMSDALKLCEKPLQKSFTIDEMCAGYEMAILLELKDTMQFCEEMIKSNAEAILKSTKFLECNRESVDKIIQLITSKCRASNRVDAYIAWAKAACRRKNLVETTANLKAQLGPSFDRMPFVEMTVQQLMDFSTTNNDFLSRSERNQIILKILERQRVEGCKNTGSSHNLQNNYGIGIDDFDNDLDEVYYQLDNEVDYDDVLDYHDDLDDFNAFDYFDY